MREVRYKNNRNQRKEKKKVEALLELIQQNTILMEYIEREYRYDEERIEVLKEILLATNKRRIKAVEQEIYLYGSMTKGKDLMARQMFLWLVGMLSEIRQLEREVE